MEPSNIDAVGADAFPAAADYRDLLREDSMSVGVYRIPAGAEDLKDPHTEDEIYHVVDGRAKLRFGETVNRVGLGDVAFVERGVDHRFFDVESVLTVLVVFTPAEHSMAEA